MLKDKGLVLRVIPYSDSARIYQCFTLDNGLISLFGRVAKSKGLMRLQTGSFIVFSAKQFSTQNLAMRLADNQKKIRWTSWSVVELLSAKKHF